MTEQNTVATPSKARQDMSADWQMIDDLLGGTAAMRSAGTRWLPKEEAESESAYHGGVVATLMQVAALTATYVLLDEDRPPKLVDFSIDYLSSAGPGDLFARCEMHRVGRRVAAVGIRCWQQDPDAPVALGRAHVFVAASASDSMVV